MQPKLGILAGGGALPSRLIDYCRENGRDYFVLGFEGQAEPGAFDADPHTWVRLGAVGQVLKNLHDADVRELVMAGSVVKPTLTELRPDLKGLQILMRIGGAYFRGDDDLLRALTIELEKEGFSVVGADGLVGDLLAPSGVMGIHLPDGLAEIDIKVGSVAARDLGNRDIGQAVIVKSAQVIASEEKKGTADLIKRCSDIMKPELGGVLIKMKKPNQDRRVDLPTIGVDTIQQAKASGLAGIAVEAGNSLIVDLKKVVSAADEAGIFLVGIDAPEQFPDGQSPLIYIIAGEPSGDRLGARLIDALKEKTGGNVRFCGVGGPAMADCGFVSNFAMEELSLMGLVEILPHLPRLLRRIKETARDVESLKPHVVITIDSPGFNHRVADRIKGIDIPVVHYVAPSVWAWKPWRARKIAKHFDHLLALLPFEPPYFETEGLPTTFVGHSVIESGADQGDGKSFRQSREIVGDTKILCVLPGSRSGEVSRLLPVIGRTLDLLNEKDLIIVVPVVDAVQVPVEAATKTWPYKVHLVAGEQEKFNAFAASNAALAASGTVALELAMARVPSVIIYDFNLISTVLARLFVKLKYVNLINILLDREAVPERILENCSAAKIAPVLNHLLVDDSIIQKQIDALDEALQKLKPVVSSPSDNAANVILEIIQRK